MDHRVRYPDHHIPAAYAEADADITDIILIFSQKRAMISRIKLISNREMISGMKLISNREKISERKMIFRKENDNGRER
jgi:hypothetical protein